MRLLKIGTRASELALYQANLVKSKLENLGIQSKIVEITSMGDEVLDKPLHQIGGFGLFTKTLDMAMLRGEIDIAVHSSKDVPTDFPKEIVQAAILKRGNEKDILVLKNNADFLETKNAVIATGSLRRKAQWLHKYPTHTVVGLRGNVNTRLKKLQENNWNGAIFAKAGLERINVLPKNYIELDWMISAPAQGAIMVTALKTDEEVINICKKINHSNTEKCIWAERQFMKTLEGGCTAPIGAKATIKNDEIHFKGILITPDGKQKIVVEQSDKIENWQNLGKQCAEEIFAKNGRELMEVIKKMMK